MTTAATLERAARRAGCTVESVSTTGGVQQSEVVCPDGWGAARLLTELCADPDDVREVDGVARAIYAQTGPGAPYARAVWNWVRKTIPFEREEGEIFQSPLEVTRSRLGDCDCHARLVVALLRAGEIPARLHFYARGGQPEHVAADAWVGGAWVTLETTLEAFGGAEWGENPVAAARRVGALRPDLTGTDNWSEITMGEIGVTGGSTYRMALLVKTPEADCGDPPEVVVQEALMRLGFTDLEIYVDDECPPWLAPEAWQGPLSEFPAWKAWARARYAGADCAELEVDPDAFPVVEVLELELDTPAPAAPPEEVTIGSTTLTSWVKDSDLVKLAKVAKDVGAEPGWLLTVLYSESGMRTIPDPNFRSGHYGLNQVDPGYLPALGWTSGLDAYKRASIAEQLDVVRAYFIQAKGRYQNATGLYLWNGLPSAFPHHADPSFVVWARPSAGYYGNVGFDAENKGYINVNDFTRQISKVEQRPEFRELRQRLADVAGSSIPLAVVVPFLMLAGTLYYFRDAILT